MDVVILAIIGNSLSQELNYIISYNKYMEDLQDEVEELIETRRIVVGKISRAKSKGEDIFEHVTKWLEDVEMTVSEAKKFLIKEGKIAVNEDNTDDQSGDHEVMREGIEKLNCLCCSCVNPVHRYKASKMAEKIIKDLKGLRKKGASFSQVSEDGDVPPSNDRNFRRDFNSRKQKDKYILDEPRGYSTNLTSLELKELPQFRKLYGDSNNLEAVHHGEDYETLSTVSMSSSSLSFQRLGRLEISNCRGSRNLLDLSTVDTLVNLKWMKLSGCNNMSTVIVESKCKEKEDRDGIVFSELETLKLRDMRALKTFHSAKCTLSFPKLNKLVIDRCQEMETFSLGTVNTPLAFKMLETIKVWRCKRLKYLFPFSIKEVLSNLSEIIVSDCEMMEAIIIIIENEAEREQGEEDANFQFPRLKSLTLENLPKLKRICGKRGRMESNKEISEIVTEEEVISDTFVSFHSQRRVFLASLCIKNCDLLEEVFETNVKTNARRGGVEQFQASRIELINLPNLKYIWSKDSAGEIQIFQNSNDLTVDNCPSLVNIFPSAFIASDLQNINMVADGTSAPKGISNSDADSDAYESNEYTLSRRSRQR